MLTPKEYRLIFQGYEKRRIREFNDAATHMYHNAVLFRCDQKKFPNLDKFLIGKDRKHDVSDSSSMENDIASLRAWESFFNKGKIN